MKNLMVLLCLVGTSAHANCIEDRWISLNEKVVQVGDCTAGVPLSLKRMEKYYPLMSDNPYRVGYWQGSYVKPLTLQVEYLHVITDRCSRSVLLSERMNKNVNRELPFIVENPNLLDSVSATYELVPMTDVEAKAALAKAQEKCEEYKAN